MFLGNVTGPHTDTCTCAVNRKLTNKPSRWQVKPDALVNYSIVTDILTGTVDQPVPACDTPQ